MPDALPYYYREMARYSRAQQGPQAEVALAMPSQIVISRGVRDTYDVVVADQTVSSFAKFFRAVGRGVLSLFRGPDDPSGTGGTGGDISSNGESSSKGAGSSIAGFYDTRNDSEISGYYVPESRRAAILAWLQQDGSNPIGLVRMQGETLSPYNRILMGGLGMAGATSPAFSISSLVRCH